MTDQSLTITPARTSHLIEIQSMIRALSAFHGDDAQVELAQLQEMFFGERPVATALIAMLGGKVVGYAGLTWSVVLHDGQQRFDIHHLYVRETARCKGVGRALITAAKAHAIAQGATRLTIGTDPRNATAIAAYRAMDILDEMLDPGPRFRVDLTAG